MTTATRPRLTPRRRQALRLLAQGYELLFEKTGSLPAVAGRLIAAIMGRPIDRGGGQGLLLTRATFDCFRDRGLIAHVKSYRSRRVELWQITDVGRATVRRLKVRRRVFLDIDGVMHHAGDRAGQFDPRCVEALNWLTWMTGAEIVVSSVWRFARRGPAVAPIARKLREQGVGARVVGVTPDLAKRLQGSGVYTGVTRGAEIKAWLDVHAPCPFVILDDDDDMEDLRDRLVQTTWEHGLTMPLAELAAKVLLRDAG